jgi:hypothetical protein
MIVGSLAPAAGAVDAEVLEDDGSATTAIPSCSANQIVVLQTLSPMARRRALALIGFDGVLTGTAADTALDVVREAIRSTCS